MIRLFCIVFGLLTFGNTQKLDHLFEQFERGEIEEVKEKLPVLIKKYPKQKKNFDNNYLIRVAINLSYTYNNVKLQPEDEVAFFPPVSGG